MKMKSDDRDQIRVAVALAVDKSATFYRRSSLIHNCLQHRWMRWELCQAAIGEELMWRLLTYLEHKHIDTMLVKALKELDN